MKLALTVSPEYLFPLFSVLHVYTCGHTPLRFTFAQISVETNLDKIKMELIQAFQQASTFNNIVTRANEIKPLVQQNLSYKATCSMQ